MFPFSVRLLRATMIPFAIALTTLPAQAAGDTMSKIRETRTVVLGVRESVPPFSFVNAQKQPVGYSVALTIKMGRLTRDSFIRPNKQAGVAMVLGHSI